MNRNSPAVLGPVEPTVRPRAIEHGSDEHLTLLNAPWHWNLLHGVDRADMLAFGRACMEAERERCAALCEAHAGMRGTGAWTVLTAAADRIRDPERAKRDAAPDSGA